MNTEHQILIELSSSDPLSTEEYWTPLFKDNRDGKSYAVDFIPFHKLFSYPVLNLTDDIEVLGDVIWELTFDGWTVERQQESINEMKKS